MKRAEITLEKLTGRSALRTHLNSEQETGCEQHWYASMIVAVMRTYLPKVLLLIASLAAALITFTATPMWAATTIAPHTTIVFFPDTEVSDEGWTDLFTEFRHNLMEALAKAPRMDPNPFLMRGDRVVPGMAVNDLVSVYLHGDCSAPAQSAHRPGGTLGWVRKSEGRIEPFIHVDCQHVVNTVAANTPNLAAGEQIKLVAEAVSRVVLHEWVHISTQSAVHDKEGIFRPRFSVRDMVPSLHRGSATTVANTEDQKANPSEPAQCVDRSPAGSAESR